MPETKLPPSNQKEGVLSRSCSDKWHELCAKSPAIYLGLGKQNPSASCEALTPTPPPFPPPSPISNSLWSFKGEKYSQRLFLKLKSKCIFKHCWTHCRCHTLDKELQKAHNNTLIPSLEERQKTSINLEINFAFKNVTASALHRVSILLSWLLVMCQTI